MTTEQIVLTAAFAAIGKLWLHVLKLQKGIDKCADERHAAHTKLVRLEERVSALQQSHGDGDSEGVWIVVDRQGIIVDAGGRVTPLIGDRAAELVGRNVICLLEDPQLAKTHTEIFAELSRQMRDLRKPSVVGKLKRLDGRPPVEVIVRLERLGEAYVLGYIFDIPNTVVAIKEHWGK